MTTSLFVWPTTDEYDDAMENLVDSMQDEELCEGNVARDTYNNLRHFNGSSGEGAGLYTCLYKITTSPSSDNTLGEWMVRCFSTTSKGKPPVDIEVRYKAIDAFCERYRNEVSALLPLKYIEECLNVSRFDNARENIKTVIETQLVPVVKMPFIHAFSLGTYIAMKYKEKEMMEQLCEAWLRMIREMEEAKMAHGDLDLTNVLVLGDGAGLMLKLIDYDNVWIPDLASFEQTESGHDGFQHPYYLQQQSRPYDAAMDRFSAFSIYISLRALTLYPQLYTVFGADDTHRLLFSKEDYVHEMNPERDKSYTNNIRKLRNMKIDVLDPYLKELSNALCHHSMPCSLDAVPPPPQSPIPYKIIFDPNGALPPWWDVKEEESRVADPKGTVPPLVYKARGGPLNQEPVAYPSDQNKASQQVMHPPLIRQSGQRIQVNRFVVLTGILVVILLIIAAILFLVLHIHLGAVILPHHMLLCSKSEECIL